MASIPMDSAHSGEGFKTICKEFALKILDFEKNIRTDRHYMDCSDSLSVRTFF